jgi:hypothetical protein
MNLNLHAIARLVVVCKENDRAETEYPTYFRKDSAAVIIHAWQVSGAYAVHDLPAEVREAAGYYHRSLTMASAWKFFALRYDTMNGTEEWPVIVVEHAASEYAGAIVRHVNSLSATSATELPPPDLEGKTAAITYRELHPEPVVTLGQPPTHCAHGVQMRVGNECLACDTAEHTESVGYGGAAS